MRQSQGGRAEYDAIAQAEQLRKERKEHLKLKSKNLLKEYRCDHMMAHKNVDVGVAMFKLLARKEEEFGGHEVDYRSTSF